MKRKLPQYVTAFYDRHGEAAFAEAGPMLLYARAIEATRAAVRGDA